MKISHRSHRILSAVLAAAAVLCAAPAFAQFGDSEFRVNTTSISKQRESAAAFAADGSAAIVWRDLRGGLTARFFPVVGEPSEDVTLVENQIFENNPGEGTIFSRRAPKIVYLPSGDFLLAWTEEKAYLRAAIFIESYTTLDQDVYAQRFSPTGEPLGSRFRVHRRGRGLQRSVSVVSAPDGSLLVAWENSDGEPGVSATDGIYTRRFNGRGMAMGREIKVDDVPGLSAQAPRLSAGEDGFLAVWEGEGDGAEGFDAYARLLDTDGRPVGPQMRLNSTLTGDQRRPQPATGADGQHLVVWYGPTEDPLIHRVYGQMVGSDGALLGPELRVSRSEEERAHALPRIAVSPSGEYLVAWLMWFGDFQTAVDGVHLDSLGAPVADAFRISEHQTSSRSIDAAAAPNGDFLVTWEGFTDDEHLGISARHVSGSQPQLIWAIPSQISAAVPSTL